MGGDEVLDRMRDGQTLAREVFETAMRVAMGKDLSRRSILLGLWQTSVSTILAVADRDDAVAVLMDRASAIKGQGANADAPVVRPDPETARKRAEESSKASEIITEHLDGLRERLAAIGAEDDLPEIVLDTAIQYLTKAWGPAHTRRALAEQADAILGGADSPIFPPEPSAWNGQGRPTPPGRVVPGRRPMVSTSTFASSFPDHERPVDPIEAKRPVVAPSAPAPASVREQPVAPPPPSMEDDAPPIDEAEDGPSIDMADDAPFAMEDEGFDTYRVTGGDEEEPESPCEPEAPEDAHVPDVAHNAPAVEASVSEAPPVLSDDDMDYASALEALGGDVPVPDVAYVETKEPEAEAHEGADPFDDVASEVAPKVAESHVIADEAVKSDGGDVAFDDLMAILDVPPPEPEPEQVTDFDEMPVPPSSATLASAPTAWQRMAASLPGEASTETGPGDPRWDVDDEPAPSDGTEPKDLAEAAEASDAEDDDVEPSHGLGPVADGGSPASFESIDEDDGQDALPDPSPFDDLLASSPSFGDEAMPAFEDDAFGVPDSDPTEGPDEPEVGTEPEAPHVAKADHDEVTEVGLAREAPSASPEVVEAAVAVVGAELGLRASRDHVTERETFDSAALAVDRGGPARMMPPVETVEPIRAPALPRVVLPLEVARPLADLAPAYSVARKVARDDRGRVVECLLVVEADDAGKSSVYACVTLVSTPGDDHLERREMEGTLPFVGRRATLAAVVKVLVSLGEPAEGERVRLLVDSDAVLAGVAPPALRPPRARPESEIEAWEDLDALCGSRSVQWVKRKPGIGKPMSEACDRMIRRRLEGLS